MNRLLALFGLLLVLFVQSLFAVDSSGARAGTWTYDVAAARRLADTTDRPLLVMFSNSSGKCAWCNKFEKEINSSEDWKIYAVEQQLAMAYINFNGPNWDEYYYQSVCTSNQTAITGFPAFVLYTSSGTNVLTSFSYNTTNLAYTTQEFIGLINSALDSGSYLIGTQDIWDHADDTAAGATVLDFQSYNLRQSHTLNKVDDSALTDTDDWYKFLCVTGRKYKFQIPAYDYSITYTANVTNSATYTLATTNLPTGYASNTITNPASTNWVSATVGTNVLAYFSDYWNETFTNQTFQIATNVVVSSTTYPSFFVSTNYSTTVHTNLPSATAQASTSGVPPEVIVPTVTFYDPTRQTRINVDAGPLGYTNTFPLTALTNGCLFTPPAAYNNAYCFLDIRQQITNNLSSFGAEVVQPPSTNLTIQTAHTNIISYTVTREIVSNAWYVVTYFPQGTMEPTWITTNLIGWTQIRTITNSVSMAQTFASTNSVVTEGTNFVSYTYDSTSYSLNYRLWVPGEIVFSPTYVSANETAAAVKISVTRRNGSAGSAKVSYSVSDGTAEDGKDYKAAEGELYWADGQTGSTNITVDLIQDLRPTWEGDERFVVSLQKHKSAPWFQAAIGAASNAVVTLKESAAKAAGKLVFSGFGDDCAPFANPAQAALAMAEGSASTLWITRSGGSNGTASVTVSTANGTALAGVSYIAHAEKLTWADGECGPKAVAITTIGREGYNRDATFTVRLSSPAGGVLGAPSAVTVIIRDDRVVSTLSDTAAAAASVGAVFKATLPTWFWCDDGLTTLRSEPLAKGGKAVLQLTLTGPGLLSFDWEMNDWYSQDSLICSGGVIAGKTLSAKSGSDTVLVKAGKQTVTWTYTKASATNQEAFGSIKNLMWQPLPKAAAPVPANGARVNPDTLSWTAPSGSSVTLGGDFEVGSGSLALTRTAVAVSPKGATLSNQTDSVTFDELWSTTSYNTTYKWRVDTVFAGDDGTLVNTGDAWSFTAVNAENDTGTPPGGTNVASNACVCEALQGVACDFGEISETSAGLTYALVGGTLPSGLKLTAATGKISGVPTVAGTRTVALQATDYSGGTAQPRNSTTVTITVYPLGAFAGNYTGWTTPDPENLPYSGAGSATVTAAGDLTAKFVIAGTTYTFSKKGFDGTDSLDTPAMITNGAWFGSSVIATSGKFTNTLDRLSIEADGHLKAALNLYSLVKKSDGTTSATSTVHQVALFRNDWTNAYMKTLLRAFAGYYTAALPVTEARDTSTAPLGSGYVTMTVGAGGSVKLSGVLADGNAWSASTTLLYLDVVDTGDTSTAGKEAAVYLYATPSAYSGKGGFCGLLRITAGTSAYGNVVDCPDAGGALQWWNFTPTCVYGATGTVATATTGFRNAAAASGGYYDTVMNLQTYYLNKTLTFADSVLASEPETATASRLPVDYDGKGGSSSYELLSDEGMLPFGAPLVVGAQSLSAAAKRVVSTGADQASDSILDCIDFSESSNVANLTLSLTRATGLLAGSFDLVYERENANSTFVRRTRKVSIKGVHTPVCLRDPADDPSAGFQGGGFYLIPEANAYIDNTGRNISYSFNWSFAFELLSSE